MALYITSLNSGSNGNCYYVGNQQEAILVDAGLSCRETERRLSRLKLSVSQVKAIFISHEHSDHIRGVEVLARKYALPVYISSKTLQRSRLNLPAELVRDFQAGEGVAVGNLKVTGFPKFHDASDPYSFVVSGSGLNIGVFTDIGEPCAQLAHYFSQCHAAFLETNYDEEMLRTGHYPEHLKRRISGKRGHLSNRQALDLFLSHKPPYMSQLLLAHLSRENNCPDLVRELFAKQAGNVNVTVASRFNESPVFVITAPENSIGSVIPFKAKPKKPTKKELAAAQLSLF